MRNTWPWPAGKQRLAELRAREPLKRGMAERPWHETERATNGRYTLMELMVCAAAHLLEDNKTAVIGTGAPLAAAMLAQKTHAPNLVILFEAGGMAPILEKLPISVGGSPTQTRAIMHSSMYDIMEACQRGMVDYSFPGRRADRPLRQPQLDHDRRGLRPSQSAPAGQRRRQ